MGLQKSSTLLEEWKEEKKENDLSESFLILHVNELSLACIPVNHHTLKNEK